MSATTPVLDHAYAIVRVDLFQDDDVPWTTRVTVKKVLWDQKVAEEEVRRLNDVNSTKGCVYFWQTTRVEKRPAPT